MQRFGKNRLIHIAVLAASLATASGAVLSASAKPEARQKGEAHPTQATAVSPLDCPKAVSPFIMAMCADAQGRIWFCTEGTGVWRYDPTDDNCTTSWTHFAGYQKENETNIATGTQAEFAMVDSSVYAAACDNLGRIWIGGIHGVSVFNGEKWRNYDVLTGPIGERVFTIAVCPKGSKVGNGDIWIGTSAGITRYSISQNTWTHYTRADGLPSEQVTALAFDAVGNLYAGTSCDGIAIARPSNSYVGWEKVGSTMDAERLMTPSGEGLPSPQIHALLVGSDNTVYAATNSGLAWSSNGGASWRYVRGADWSDKSLGSYDPPAKQRIEAIVKHTSTDAWLLEDYCTSLYEAAPGHIYVGHWRQGCELFDVKKGRRIASLSGKSYVRCLLPDSAGTGKIFIGCYGEGIQTLAPADFSLAVQAPHSATAKKETVPLPAPVGAPLPADLDALLKKAKNLALTAKTDGASILPDDWRTRGEWQGRYGNIGGILCAMNRPFDQTIGPQVIGYRKYIGVHHKNGDALRNWMQWLYTDQPRCLELPTAYMDAKVSCGETTWQKNRRESEWDDHGEAYPTTHDGPDVLCDFNVVKAPAVVSLYFVNPNGHEGNNRCRDYLVTLQKASMPADLTSDTETDKEFLRRKATPVLARARIFDFWNGAYKRILVTEPGWYTLRVARNGSFNSILSGVFVDTLEWPTGKMADEELEPDPGADPDYDPLLDLRPEAVQDSCRLKQKMACLRQASTPIQTLPLWRAMNQMLVQSMFKAWEGDAQANIKPPWQQKYLEGNDQLADAYSQMLLFGLKEGGIKSGNRKAILNNDRVHGVSSYQSMDEWILADKKAMQRFYLNKGDTQ